HLEALLSLPGVPPPRVPPHGHVALSAERPHPILVPVGGDPDLRAPLIGLRARLPARFTRVRIHDSDLSVDDGDNHARGLVSHGDQAYARGSFGDLVAHLTPILASGVQLEAVSTRDVTLPIGVGKEARWPMADGLGEARFVALPLCDGRKTLLVTIVARGEE